MPDQNPVPEGLELRKDGTVVVHLDTERVQLRRPKLRELRELRAAMWEIDEELSKFAAEASTEIGRLRDKATESDDATLADEIGPAVRRLRHETTTMGESLWLEWTGQVIEVLGPHPVNTDDLPPWAGTAAFAEELMRHWLTVPTRRGR